MNENSTAQLHSAAALRSKFAGPDDQPGETGGDLKKSLLAEKMAE